MRLSTLLLGTMAAVCPLGAVKAQRLPPGLQSTTPGSNPAVVIPGCIGTGLDAGFAVACPPTSIRRPPAVFTTLPTATLATGVSQVVIPAGSIVNGCEVTFSNSYGEWYLAYTDPAAPTIPTATVGRGIHIQFQSGVSDAVGYVYRCPYPTGQGISVIFVAHPSGTNAPSDSPSTAYVGASVF